HERPALEQEPGTTIGVDRRYVVECPTVVEPGLVGYPPHLAEGLDRNPLGEFEANPQRMHRAMGWRRAHGATTARTRSQHPKPPSIAASPRWIHDLRPARARRKPHPPSRTTPASPAASPLVIATADMTARAGPPVCLAEANIAVPTVARNNQPLGFSRTMVAPRTNGCTVLPTAVPPIGRAAVRSPSIASQSKTAPPARASTRSCGPAGTS